MYARFVLALGLTSCVAGLSGSLGTSTSPTGPNGPGPAGPGQRTTSSTDGAAATAPYTGSDGLYVREVANMTRSDAEELLRGDGFTNIVATGDTDPAAARDELVCEQIPPSGTKVARTAVITIRYCNTYKPMHLSPELVGLSVAAAKQRAKAAGFAGEIEVLTLNEWAHGCKTDTVCRIDPDHWELNQEHTLTLFVNPKFSAPSD